MKKALILTVGLALTLLYGCYNDSKNGNGKSKNKTDAVKASPKNYKTVFENDKVRVLKKQIKPGEYTEWHASPTSVYYVIEDADVREHYTDQKPKEQKLKKGSVFYQDKVKQHMFENLGQTNAEAIVIELKKD